MNMTADIKNPKFEQTYAKWRKSIMKTNVYLVLMILVAETIMFFVLKKMGMILISNIQYLIKYLIVPSGVNLLILLAGWYITKIQRSEWKYINYIPVVQQMLLGMVVAAVHCMFRVTMCVFCIPIMLAVIFSDKKMARNLSFIAAGCLGVVCVYRHYMGDFAYEDVYIISEAMVTLIIILATNMVCRILIEFQKEKDVAIKKSYQKELEMQEQINRDQKTGLLGASAFSNALFCYAQEAADSKDTFALVMIDIDDFKTINDTFGHANGDIVIRRLAETLKYFFAGKGIPSRFGGEEFTVIIKEHDEKRVQVLLEQFRSEIEKQRYDFMGKGITVSMGYSMWKEGFTDTVMFEQADTAMYYAKKLGKNRIVDGNRMEVVG